MHQSSHVIWIQFKEKEFKEELLDNLTKYTNFYMITFSVKALIYNEERFQ
jgi:hypothetical protein